MLATLLLTTLAGAACAYPGMGSPDFHDSLQRLAGRDNAPSSTALIGDLCTLSSRQLSQTGSAVAQILTGQASGEVPSASAYSPARLNSQACAQDTCCIWHYIAQTMSSAFSSQSGRCNDLARQAIRLGFHDAAGWSLATGPHGGADGSLVLSYAESTRSDNNGLESIIAQMRTWYSTYARYGVSMADLIQFGSITATVVCPLGPRTRFFAGRPDSSVPAPDGLLPQPSESAATLTARFRNMTIEPAGLVALVGAHTTSQQRFVDTSRRGDPQDSTPGVWDTLYYSQTLGSAPPRVFKFQSDVNLAHAYTGVWQSFEGQSTWGAAYSREYVRLSLLGVYNINDLTECTKAVPSTTTTWAPSDQAYTDAWLSTDTQSSTVADAMMNGDLLSTVANAISSLLGLFF